MTEALGPWGKLFAQLKKFETSVIENVAAVPVFVAKPRAKFFTVQKLDKQLLFKLVRAMPMEMISDAVINNRRVQ
jgi:hypothetical protein